MAKTQMHDYTVEGAGQFPIDMLRYGQAWPTQETDTAWRCGHSSRPRTVSLTGLSKPQAARWASFGWTVTAHTVRSVTL